MSVTQIPTLSYPDIRYALLNRYEIAILDVREEAPFAEAHPLFAANLPWSKIETEVYNRIPNKDPFLVVYDDGEGLAVPAAKKLINLGYSNVYLLEGGLDGWRNAGGEIFRDVNSPSKAFGELVESKRHTPSLSAAEVQQLIDNKEDIVVMDVRRFDEYNTMSIPTGISVPGAELVLRARELAPNVTTKIIVNCAGRTRSIIGTQSLINAGIPNSVAALRNGTIGWTLAGQQLEQGQVRRFAEEINNTIASEALQFSRKVADLAGVKRTNLKLFNTLIAQADRTNYCFDVRSPEEYAAGHLPGFISAPGGQLVQETDHYAPVRGARVSLADDNGTRANMTASWLAQMGWDVYVIDDITKDDLTETGNSKTLLPPLPELDDSQLISAEELFLSLQEINDIVLIDLGTAKEYINGHIPGSWFVLRSQLDFRIKELPFAESYVLISPDGISASFALPELQEITQSKVLVLDGGTKAWTDKKFKLKSGETNIASPMIDRYRRPYEGTDNAVEAMQAYLDWEYGLVDQLDRDGTHGFFVI
ncbi:sulfurtransferase [Solitalea longa]|uniref:Sulfurtransferase n=2 Tax=Solitalea longa TaxID=2079460 RepID=A0A2S5A8Z4_9SPHI|nr:sulfurtransferase [Solitalea longa]